MNAEKTVLIVGAGPTGMMAALELARFRIPVRLVEKSLQPATTSRAVGVQARTLELFEQRGIEAPLLQFGNAAHAVSVYGDNRRIFGISLSQLDSKYRCILFVSQAETEHVLRDALQRAGVDIEWGTSMTALGESERDGLINAVLKHRDGKLEELPCAYLISAEGAHSTVRQTLNLEFEGKSLHDEYALGDFYIEGDLTDQELHIFSSEHGFLGMFPMGQKRFRMIASNPISGPAAAAVPSIDELQQIYNQRSHIALRFQDMNWSSWFSINSRMVEKMQSGRIFLGGDAAHIHSPAGAQGMNTGLQDMVNLGWKMALVLNGQADASLLETYAAERMPVIKSVLSNTERLTDMIGDENHMFRSVFNHVAPWITSIEAVEQSAAERISQLAISYPHSPLSGSGGHLGALAAGDRMPDIPVRQVGVHGPLEEDSTFRMMDPSRFTLFLSNHSEPMQIRQQIDREVGPWLDLIDIVPIAATAMNHEQFQQLFGKFSALVLVRPDGYIGYTGSEHSLQSLHAYLGRWLLPHHAPADAPAQHRDVTL